MVVFALDAEMDLLMGQVACIPLGPLNGPDCLFGCAFSSDYGDSGVSGLVGAVNLCLSGPEDWVSGPNSPRLDCKMLEQAGVLPSPPDGAGVLPSPPELVPSNVVDGSPSVQSDGRAQPAEAIVVPVEEFIASFKKPLS
jgi:hypothetical protein